MSQKSYFDAKCTNCGQATTVPFKPSPNKPVYCKTCFNSRPRTTTFHTAGIHDFNRKQAWARRR